MRIWMAILALMVAHSAVSSTPTQLVGNARPSHYDVWFEPDAKSLTFKGKTRIDLEIPADTASIVLNATALSFTKAQLQSADLKQMWDAKVVLDPLALTASFDIGKTIPKGKYTLLMDYTGKIQNQAYGLYAADFLSSGEQQRALFTQFEAPDARRLFPCFDEPSYKATFTLSSTIPKAWFAVSNMPIATTSSEGDKQTVAFQTTPLMSTYLVFFAAGEFERMAQNWGKVQVGVVTRAGAIDQGKLALQSNLEILPFFASYFGVKYPLPKLDNIAVPGVGGFGAMENWGAVTYFENRILNDPKLTSAAEAKFVWRTIAHELAHQWFGNLVTMAWWDDLWLNESFAMWAENKAAKKLHPAWEPAYLMLSDKQTAIDQDGFSTTHPIVQEIKDVAQINSIFDAITYEKGANVVTMLEDAAGEKAWQKGVNSYLKQYAYKNTSSEDLWRAIDHASSQRILPIAHDFTQQPGVPLVQVESSQCVGGKTVVTLSEAEFSYDRPLQKRLLLWHIPITLNAGKANLKVVLNERQQTFKVDGCGTLVVNKNQIGYFRVLYTEANRAQILKNFSQLDGIDQYGILADAFALGLAEFQPMAFYLDLVAALPQKASSETWQMLASHFLKIASLYDDEQQQAAFCQWAIKVLRPQLDKIGWTVEKGEDANAPILRETLIVTLGVLGDTATIQTAQRLFDQQEKGQAIPGTLLQPVYYINMRYADSAKWERFHDMAKNAKSGLEAQYLYPLLLLAKDQRLAQKGIDIALSDGIRAQLKLNMLLNNTAAPRILSATRFRNSGLLLALWSSKADQLRGLIGGMMGASGLQKLSSGQFGADAIAKWKVIEQTFGSPSTMQPYRWMELNMAFLGNVVKDVLPQVNVWLKKSPSPALSKADKLNQLYAQYWEDQLKLNPLLATQVGDTRYNDQLVDFASAAFRKNSHNDNVKWLSRIKSIGPDGLSAEDLLSYQVFVRNLEDALEAEKYPDWMIPVQQFYSPLTDLTEMGTGEGTQTFNTVKDYNDWASRAKKVPTVIASMINNMKTGIKNGVVQPKILMERLVDQLNALIQDEPTQSLFWRPITKMPKSFSEQDKTRLELLYKDVIGHALMPSYRQLRDFIRDDYLPKARSTAGYGALPNGKAWYAYLARHYTTTDVPPETIHEIGLKLVDEIHADMRALMKQVGFKGTLAEFFTFMKTDKQFSYESEDALLKYYRGLEATVRAHTPKQFSLLPKAAFEIRPMPAYRAANSAGGEYQAPSQDGSRPGVFSVNTYDLPTRKTWEAEDLFLHEAMPGHHFQIALTQELSLPSFRRFGGYTAFVEGWALYAESLGKDLGLYQSPYGYFGYLQSRLWRAIRLVVDTGLHAKGWTREQAIQYMLDNSAASKVKATAETERYMAMPGQALSYMMGARKILELKERAQKALGDRFDVRAFHAEVLKDGALPLDVLDAKITRWIKSQQN